VYRSTAFRTWNVSSECSDQDDPHCVNKCVATRRSFLGCVCSTISSGISATKVGNCRCYNTGSNEERRMARQNIRYYFMFLGPCIFIQGDSGGICTTLGNDSTSDSEQKSSYEHGSDFERLRSWGHFLIPVHALM
jgi:hypothetical protein